MKRYEKMSKEELFEIARRFTDCNDCPKEDLCQSIDDCTKMFDAYMNEEVDLIPRAWTFETADEAQIEFEKICDGICAVCRYGKRDNHCRFEWLYELVEKPDTSNVQG